MALSVYTSLRDISVDDARALSRSSQARCWKGTPLPHPFSWSVAVDPQTLWFVCSLPGGQLHSRGERQGEYVEGLWNRDVAELFIKSPEGRYQEFNVAPSGAWWAMTLSEYRKRDAGAKRPHLTHISCTLGEGSWEVVAAFERRSLDVDIAPSASIHVSGMWYHPEPTFLSSHPPHGVEPDYHHTGCFQPITMVSTPG